MINSNSSTLNMNFHRSPYQNGMNSIPRKVLSYPQQTSYVPYTDTNTTDVDSKYSFPQATHSSTYVQPLNTESHLSLIHDSDNGTSNTKTIQSNTSKFPSFTSTSSCNLDDIESVNSSFSESPAVSNENNVQQTKNFKITSTEIFDKLREMGHEQDRNLFVDRLKTLWKEQNLNCRKLPSISRQTIDLYRLYLYVREKNGFEQFSKIAKSSDWRDIASKLNISNTSTTAFQIKQKYIHFKLFHYECKYDRGDIDPEIQLANMEKNPEQTSKTITKENNEKSTTIEDQSSSSQLRDIDTSPSVRSKMSPLSTLVSPLPTSR